MQFRVFVITKTGDWSCVYLGSNFVDIPTNVNKHCYTDYGNEEIRALIKQLYTQELIITIMSVTLNLAGLLGTPWTLKMMGKKGNGICRNIFFWEFCCPCLWRMLSSGMLNGANLSKFRKKTFAEFVYTEEGGNHNPFPEIFLSFYETTRRHIPKITLLFFYSCCFLILSGCVINGITFYRFHSSAFWRYS